MNFTITRHFDAPRDLVFEAWTQKEHLDQWSAPKGFTIPFSEGDLRPGGSWRSMMVAPDGEEHRLGGVYQEIVSGERLSFTHAWEEEHGRGPESLVQVHLFDEDGDTRMEFSQGPFQTPVSRDGHQGGWSECFDRLDAYLADLKFRQVVLTRTLPVAPQVVFDAWIDQAQLAEWWGPHGFTNPVCEIDVKVGGVIHIDMASPDGTVYPMSGVYREIDPPHKLVFLNSPLDDSGKPIFELVTTVIVEPAAGGSTLTVRARLEGEVTDASAPFLSGMQEGWRQSLERLEAFLSH